MDLTAPRWSRRDLAVVLALVVVLSISWLPRIRGPIDLRWDGALYYELGTSLASGAGYRLPNEPGDLRAVVWPPMLPALIAAEERALGTSDAIVVGRALRLTFVALWIVYIASTYWFLRRLAGIGWAAGGTLLTGLSLTAIWLSDRCYADLPFALAGVWFLIAATRSSRVNEAAAAASATAAFLLRTAGIAFLAAWIADALLRRRWRTALVRVAFSAVPILSWQGYIAHVERQDDSATRYAYQRADYSFYNVSYARNMMLRDPMHPDLGRASAAELPARVAMNARTLPHHVGETVTAVDRDLIEMMIAIKARPIVRRLVPWRLIDVVLLGFGFVTIAGVLLWLRSPFPIFTLTFGAYALLLSLLPTDYHWPRYLADVAPLVCASLLFALRAIHRSVALARPRWAPACAFAIRGSIAAALAIELAVLTWHFAYDLRTVQYANWNGRDVDQRMFSYDDAWLAFDRALDWLKTHANRSDVVVSSMPHWVYVRTNLQSVMPPFVSDRQHAAALMDSARPAFVVIDRSGFSPTATYALPVVDADASWSVCFESGDGLAQIYCRSARLAELRSPQRH